MQEHIKIRSTSKTAIYVVCSAVVVVLALAGLKRLMRSDERVLHRQVSGPTTAELTEVLEVPAGYRSPLLPVVELTIADASLEANWSQALAIRLDGRTEVPIENGRVDVLTADYAIEVDRLEKWHEAIGQAAHYGLSTNKIPVAALIVASDEWPMSETNRSRLLLIDKTCTAQSVKLILLRRGR